MHGVPQDRALLLAWSMSATSRSFLPAGSLLSHARALSTGAEEERAQTSCRNYASSIQIGSQGTLSGPTGSSILSYETTCSDRFAREHSPRLAESSGHPSARESIRMRDSRIENENGGAEPPIPQPLSAHGLAESWEGFLLGSGVSRVPETGVATSPGASETENTGMPRSRLSSRPRTRFARRRSTPSTLFSVPRATTRGRSRSPHWRTTARGTSPGASSSSRMRKRQTRTSGWPWACRGTWTGTQRPPTSPFLPSSCR